MALSNGMHAFNALVATLIRGLELLETHEERLASNERAVAVHKKCTGKVP